MIKFNSKLLKNQGKLTVCVSGGVDSVVCLHFLARSNPHVKAFHFNHKMIPEDDAIQERVVALCELIKVPLIIGDGSKYSSVNTSKEAFAREIRYACIDELLTGNVIVCHHLDDAVESYIINCCNGHPDWRPLPERTDRASCTIFRPFLLTSKSDFVRYAETNGLGSYVYEDPFNYEGFRRNRVRNEVIPTLRNIFPGINKIVSKKLTPA